MSKTVNRIFLIMLAMLMNGSLLADVYIEIGSGTITGASQPIYSSWNYSWSGQIYPQAALGGAKNIKKIAYNCTNGPKAVTNQKFYLKNSTETIFSTANYESPETNGYTKVFEGDITFQNGWNEITLTTPFPYNGTGSLIVFNENRWGQSYGPNFMSTPSTINNNKSCGSDASFPITAGYLNPYPSTLANIRIIYEDTTVPATPDNFLPVSNTKKVKVDNAFTFTLGVNTATYDLYMSTDSVAVAGFNASAKVVADHAAINGTNSFTPNPNLLSRSVYFWRVVAKNSTTVSNGPLLKFRTQLVISQFPFNEGFESFNPPAFPGATPISSVIDLNYPMEREWSYPTNPFVWQCSFSDTLYPHSGKHRVKADIFSTGQNMSHNLMTPRLYLPANQRITYWWKNHTYESAKTTGYDSCYFEVTTNGGTTWTQLTVGSPAEMTAYEKATIDLSAFSGNNTYLRWRFKTPPNWSDCRIFSLDDIKIETISADAVIELDVASYDFQPLAINGKSKIKVKISNTGSSVLNITSVTVAAPFSCDFTGSISAGQFAYVSVYFAPTTATNSNSILTFNSNAVSGGNTINLSGTGVTLTGSFSEAFDASASLPENWSKIKSATDQYTDVTIQTSGAHTVPNMVKMLVANDSISPLLLVTPGVGNFAQNKLSFWAYNYSTKPINLKVGLLENPYEADSFAEVQNFVLPVTTDPNPWAMYEVTFSAANIKPYIAFKFGHVKGAFVSLRIDDVSWAPSGVIPSAATCVFPLNNDANTNLQPKLTWSAGTGNPTGYKVYFGNTSSPTTMVADQPGLNFQIPNMLNLSTDYYWKVIPYNAFGDAVNCPVWKFTTLSDPTISFPNANDNWSEGFDQLVQTTGSTVPLGWVSEIASTQPMAANWDLLIPANPAEAYSPPKCMNVGPSFYAKDCWLISVPFNFKTGNSYSVSYWFKNAIALGDETESMEVKIGKETGSVLANQKAATLTTMLNNHASITGSAYTQGYKQFTVTQDGLYYIGFHAYSPETNFILFLDQIEVVNHGSGINDFLKPVVTALQQNYPNPFNPETAISFSLANAQDVKISVYNIKGELVETLLSAYLPSGDHLINFNAADLPSGIYFYKMETAGFNKVMKMNLIK